MSELDIERPEQLLAYLRSGGRVEPDETPRIKRLAGGVSNRTVLVERENGDRWVIKQALERLRVEVEWLSDPRRIHREAAGLRVLGRLLTRGSVPGLVFEDFDHQLLAMGAVAEPHENWKEMLMAGDLRREHVDLSARLLSQIHSLSSMEQGELRADFADKWYFQTLRLEPYYLYTGEQLPDLRGFMQELVEETLDRNLALVHGDYSPKNILVRGSEMVLLDHEVVHLGDPAFDVGFFMTHLLSKAHYLSNRRARFAEAARLFWRSYRDGIGKAPTLADGIEGRSVRHTIACLLARVLGRSRLEYLDEGERRAQIAGAACVARRPPRSMDDLIDAFLGGL